MINDFLYDIDFLKRLAMENIKTTYIKVVVLNQKELPVREITGSITQGSLTVDGNSSVRRTASFTFLAEERDNDLHDIDVLLTPDKRISVEIGITNKIDTRYPEICWFKQGIFVIIQPGISHNMSGVTINLSCKDKMCLLNGECGGTLPASITFHEYDQMLDDGSYVTKKNLIYDIIQTLVMNYGREPINKIFINDIALEIKQIVHYTGSNPLFYNSQTKIYTTNDNYVVTNDGNWTVFEYNDEVGYVYTDFTYPGELVSGIGETVTSVLDKIIATLGNYEYFYDTEGNFIFQEKRNYLNNSYSPVDAYRLDNNKKVAIPQINSVAVVNETNYKVDFSSNTKVVFDFEEGSTLVTAFSSSPSYTNIKNDFHIWGQNKDNRIIHYHLAIKEKPKEFLTRKVVFLTDESGAFTGRLRLAKDSDENSRDYTPQDWRAELYLQGLEKQARQERPDIYEQELLDNFDSIYNFTEANSEGTLGGFKTDIVRRPNNLCYFMDFLEPAFKTSNCSVDSIDMRTHTYQQDKINKLYDMDVPNVILVNLSEKPEIRESIITRCSAEGQDYANIETEIYSNLTIGAVGYSAATSVREMLYQYTDYNETITIQTVPIYHLEPNTRISVSDRSSKIFGDYVIKSYTLPLDGKSIMSISATKALERI